MSRVLTFSRHFPAYHPQKGKPTYFVEKIWKSIWDSYKGMSNPLYPEWQKYDVAFPVNPLDENQNIHNHVPKHHTIRAGNRWKVGDTFSPRVWTGKPYASKQLQFVHDIEVKKVWDFRIEGYKFFVNDKLFYHQHVSEWHHTIEALAKNDGFIRTGHLFDWFKLNNKTSFTGQIICWNDSIHY